MRRNGRAPHQDTYAIVLLFQLFRQIWSLEYKPPVTVGLVAAMVTIHLRRELKYLPIMLTIRPVLSLVPSVDRGCMRAAAVVRGDWSRLFWSALLHADNWHLYYNMSSLLLKGVDLELSMGSAKFLALLAELWLSSHVITVLLYWACARYLGVLQDEYAHTCIVGFSAVLFAMKTVSNLGGGGIQRVQIPYLGSIPMPPKYVSWAELLIAQWLVPNASFMGHLSGIIAGTLHVKLTRRVLRLIERITQFYQRWNRRFQRGSARFHGGGPSGRRQEPQADDHRAPPVYDPGPSTSSGWRRGDHQSDRSRPRFYGGGVSGRRDD